MQKKILAAVVASVMAGQAMAVTVIDNGTDKVTIGGHVGMRYVDQTDGKSEGDSSRINFGFEHKLTEATTAFAKAEWGFDVTDTDGDVFSNRLGYLGAKNDQFGSISYGKQWSTYYTVAGWTDVLATTGGNTIGTYSRFGDALGTARADDAIQYNHSIMGLNISAQAQLGEREVIDSKAAVDFGTRDSSYAIAASYDLPMGLSFGAAYNQAEVKDLKPVVYGSDKLKAKSAVIGAKFEADKIYAAFTYAELRNLDDKDYLGFVKEAQGMELYASYQLNEMFKVGGGYNQLKDESNSAVANKGEIKYIPVEVVYTQGPVQLSGTYEFQDSVIAGTTESVDDKLILQARYYF
ncbi:porin [Endozoicomonas sp. SCSIO W0465]|uniref:porin n=1 Tax=Endozoicomonas sp. SCSIO W0465 TaxID=2918516 RepID=UPI0020761FF3|nr:porin [Endozoicomonas sp. SCSIO W0465]USE37172.1 porin [Endozoicomonas sp. SCSIO W0465]